MHLLRRFVVPAAVLALFPAAAYPACTLADMAGSWQLYSTGYTETTKAYWTRCVIAANALGKFTGGSCSTSAGTTQAIVKGNFLLSSGPSCLFTGKFSHSAGQDRYLTQFSLSRDKLVASGFGRFVGGFANSLFSMTKL